MLIWKPMSLFKARLERNFLIAQLSQFLIGKDQFIIRLNTVADYDKVMVIEAGGVAEFGPPLELLSNNL